MTGLFKDDSCVWEKLVFPDMKFSITPDANHPEKKHKIMYIPQYADIINFSKDIATYIIACPEKWILSYVLNEQMVELKNICIFNDTMIHTIHITIIHNEFEVCIPTFHGFWAIKNAMHE